MTDTTGPYDAIRAARGPTKRCTACATDHPVENFPFKNRDKLQLHAKCKTAQRVASRADYAANGDRRRAKTYEYRAWLRSTVNELVADWLTGRTCRRCGETDKHLIAVGADGENIRARSRDGFMPDDIRALLVDAEAECWGCRSTR